MFETFEAEFLPELPFGKRLPNTNSVAGWDEFMAKFAGATCLRGLYRIHNAQSGQIADAFVREAFPDVAFSTCFGFDWCGRQFAFNPHSVRPEGPDVILLDPVEGQAYEMPYGFEQLHDLVLFQQREIVLMINEFAEWMQQPIAPETLGVNSCVTHEVPLFLGGKDELDNLELADIEVTWSLLGQLRAEAMHLPVGAPVGNVSIS